MKKSIISLLSVIFVSLLCYGQREQTETRKLSPFDEVKVFGGITCELIKADEEKVVLYYKNINSGDIVTELSGMQLKIRLKIKWYDEIDVKAIVYYKHIEEFVASAGSSLYSNDMIGGDHLEIDANTGSDVELKLDAGYVEVVSEQGSKVFLHGKAETLDIEINTGGEVMAFNTSAENVMVKINAGGTAEVNVTQKLSADVTLGGTVKYKGNPADVSQNTSLGGSIYSVD